MGISTDFLKDIGLIKNSLTKENKLFERGCFFGPCVRDYFVSNRQSNVPFHILLSNDSPENINEILAELRNNYVVVSDNSSKNRLNGKFQTFKLLKKDGNSIDLVFVPQELKEKFCVKRFTEFDDYLENSLYTKPTADSKTFVVESFVTEDAGSIARLTDNCVQKVCSGIVRKASLASYGFWDGSWKLNNDNLSKLKFKVDYELDKSVDNTIRGFIEEEFKKIKTADQIKSHIKTIEDHEKRIITQEQEMAKLIIKGDEMEEKKSAKPDFISMMKQDATKASYRVAANQITVGTKKAIVNIMKSQGMDNDKLSSIAEMLDTPIGEAFVSFIIGLALNYIPTINDNKHAQVLSEEFRINGMATFGNEVVDVVVAQFLPVLTEGLNKLEKINSINQLPEKVRVTHAATVVNPKDVEFEEQEIQEEVKEKAKK